jgi:hypothetical protein
MDRRLLPEPNLFFIARQSSNGGRAATHSFHHPTGGIPMQRPGFCTSDRHNRQRLPNMLELLEKNSSGHSSSWFGHAVLVW